jgi:hypothetical protein
MGSASPSSHRPSSVPSTRSPIALHDPCPFHSWPVLLTRSPTGPPTSLPWTRHERPVVTRRKGCQPLASLARTNQAADSPRSAITSTVQPVGIASPSRCTSRSPCGRHAPSWPPLGIVQAPRMAHPRETTQTDKTVTRSERALASMASTRVFSPCHPLLTPRHTSAPCSSPTSSRRVSPRVLPPALASLSSDISRSVCLRVFIG